LKILNLYAGIGGNRKDWGNEHEVTAVEYDPAIAAIYADLYPTDTLIVGDAHQYLLENYKDFDFIWSSPPCQTHSSFRFNINVRFRGTEAKYPDMSLYQEIIFLSTHFDGKYVVENVKPYYEPLIKPTVELQRHYFWANFNIPVISFKSDKIRSAQIPDLQELHKVDLSNYKLSNKRQVLRNCVLSEVGSHIVRHAI
jgi:DNA (cytosine-5)-methyltransferase 1